MKSFYEHHGMEMFELADQEDEAGMPRIERRDPQCNRCKSTDVRWRQQGGRWVLFSLTPGVEHRCPINADEFGEVAE